MNHRLRCKVWWSCIDNQAKSYLNLVNDVRQLEKVVNWNLCLVQIYIRCLRNTANIWGPPSGEHILVVVDFYSRWFEVDIYRKTPDWERVIRSLFSVFITCCFPLSLQTDNGPQLIGGQFAQYMYMERCGTVIPRKTEFPKIACRRHHSPILRKTWYQSKCFYF